MEEHQKLQVANQNMERQLKLEAEKVVKADEDKKKSIAVLNHDMNMLRDELGREHSKNDALNQKLATLKEQVEQDKGTMSEMGDQLQQTTKECLNYQQQIRELQEIVEDRKKAEKCHLEKLTAANVELKEERNRRQQTDELLKKQKHKMTSKQKQIEDLQSQLDAKCQASQDLQAANDMLQRKEKELSDITGKLELCERESQSKQKTIESLQLSLKNVEHDLDKSKNAYKETHESAKKYRTERNEAREELRMAKQSRRSSSPCMSRKNDLSATDKQSDPSLSRVANGVSVGYECRHPKDLLQVNAQQTERKAAGLAQRVPNNVSDQSIHSLTEERNTTSTLKNSERQQPSSHSQHQAVTCQDDQLDRDSPVPAHGANYWSHSESVCSNPNQQGIVASSLPTSTKKSNYLTQLQGVATSLPDNRVSSASAVAHGTDKSYGESGNSVLNQQRNSASLLPTKQKQLRPDRRMAANFQADKAGSCPADVAHWDKPYGVSGLEISVTFTPEQKAKYKDADETGF